MNTPIEKTNFALKCGDPENFYGFMVLVDQLTEAGMEDNKAKEIAMSWFNKPKLEFIKL